MMIGMKELKPNEDKFFMGIIYFITHCSRSQICQERQGYYPQMLGFLW